MITKEQIGYELEIEENVSIDDIRKAHPTDFLIWLAGSGQSPNGNRASYRYLVEMGKNVKFVKGENDLEELETEDYIALLSEIAENYEGFTEMECDDIIEVCENYGLDTDIDDDDFSNALEKMENMNIPSLEEYL